MEYNELFQDIKRREQEHQQQEAMQIGSVNEKLTLNDINITKESSRSKTNADESGSNTLNSAKLDSRMDIT